MIEPEGRPSWRMQVEYSNHTVQDISSYGDYLPERPEERYLSLLEYYKPEVSKEPDKVTYLYNTESTLSMVAEETINRCLQ